MQPTVFQPNNHSRWEIRYRPVLPETAEALKTLFLTHYSNLADSIASIEQVDEAEINSNNFKATAVKKGKKDVFLLRRYPAERSETAILSIYEVVNFLRGRDLSVPEIINSDAGEALIFVPPYRYSVFRFETANHYRGTLEELKSVAKGIGNLDAALSAFPNVARIKPVVAFPPRALALREFSEAIWEGLFQKAEKYRKEHPEDEFNSRVLAFRDLIMNALRETPPECYATLPSQLTHIDLHPHNLLTDGHALSVILDFDSLRFVERMRGVAFGLHRLVRQHIVFDNPPDIRKAVHWARHTFLDAYQTHNQLSEEEIQALPYFIRNEALSRLSYAMKEFYATGEKVWTGDLEKQTATIAEAAYFE